MVTKKVLSDSQTSLVEDITFFSYFYSHLYLNLFHSPQCMIPLPILSTLQCYFKRFFESQNKFYSTNYV